MKILLGFILGILAGVAGMYYLYLPRVVPAAAPAAPVAAPAVVVPAPTPALPPAATATADPALAPTATTTASTTTSTSAITAPAAATGTTTTATAGGTAAMAVPAATLHPDKLAIPVAGIQPQALQDTFGEPRSQGRHEAIDILAPKGARVTAVADGRVVKLFNSKEGGLTVYQFDPNEKFSYYYAHLDRYAPGLTEGQSIRKGDLIGFVGNSGNADPKTPHLHFAVFELTPEKQWWKGTALNPYELLKP